MTIIVREYEPGAPAGLVGEWLTAREIPWRVSRPAEEPEIAGDADAVIALGSSASAYWTDPDWIDAECDQLAATNAADIPILGICFGAQALARALGGEVRKATQPEIGWVQPVSDEVVLGGPYLAWHSDEIALPPGARELARSDRALQAYTHGNAMGLQFHPEVTPAIWREWSEHEPAALAREVVDPEALQADIAATTTETRARCFALMDWWHGWLTGRF